MHTERELTNFQKLAASTKEQLLATKELSLEWLQQAVDASADQLQQAGELSKEEAARLTRYLKRDLAATRVDFDRAATSLHRGLDPSRVGGGFFDLAAHLFGSMGDTFHEWAARSEEVLAFHTGEVSGPGTLTCTDCANELHLLRPSHIPPCPTCHKTEFRKSY